MSSEQSSETQSSSWFGRILFSDANRLVKRARQHILQESDMLPLPDSLNPRRPDFHIQEINWSEGPRIVWTMLWAARRRLVWPYLCYVFATVFSLVPPILVNKFVGGISAGLQDPENFRTVLIIAVLLGVVAIGRGTFLQHYFFGTLKVYQLCVNAVNERLFRHSLKMSGSARLKTPIGDVVNHMSSDSETIADFIMLVADAFWTVATLLGVVGMLFYYIGWSAVLPLILLATLAPTTRWMAKKFTKLEETMMHERDLRVTLMGQILNAIRVVKYFAWERSVIKEVTVVRERELNARRRMGRGEAFSTVTYVAVSSVVLFVALAIHAWRGFALDPALVFTCVSLFGLLEEPLGGLSWLLSRTMNAFVSANRVAKFLGTETLKERPSLPVSSEFAVGLSAKDLATFPGLDLEIKPGESVALVGPVGCGKSTLLSVFLGEDPADRERVRFFDSRLANAEARTGYVPQEAYIVNGSLKENLLFGEAEVSDQVLRGIVHDACLDADLRELPAGLATEIGEKGVNLSGGQKQRVSLARAILQNPQIVFLDDPLSAVDVETEEKLCDRLIFGRWSKLTRVVATHRLESLRRFDRILFLEHGKVQDQGTYDQLILRSGRFAAFVRDHQLSQGNSETAAATSETSVTAAASAPAPVTESRITDDEEREIGAVKGSVYLDYFRSLGGEGAARNWRLALLLLGATSVMVLPLAQRWWLGVTSTYQQSGAAEGLAGHLVAWGMGPWLKDPLSSVFVYGAIGILTLFATLGNALWWIERGLQAGRLLQEKMLRSLLKANIRFFDSTPVGRILQRFSRDVESVDLYLQKSFDQAVHILIEVILCLILISAAVPVSIILVAPAMLLYYVIQRDYRRPAREVKRLDSIARSPRFAHFKETLTGLPVIRGFRREEWFLKSFFDKLEHSQRMFYSHYVLNRWFSVRVPLIGGLISVATAVAIAWSAREGAINAGVAGVLTIYMLSFWSYLNWGIRIFADIESRMTSVERLRVYANLPEEKDQFLPRSTEVPAEWPRTGDLRVENIQARYASHLPQVLKGISFHVKAGERVGIIGRTGSGKSTLFQCLFRFVELEGGAILLDGEDIASIPLEKLRRNLAIIPQDPALFMGTIRSNLDRYGEHSDADIEAALTKASMWKFVSKLPNQLEFQVAENGLNLSQGQRQLLCLARALLSKAKLIVLDEATASVDVETDAILQKVIRESLQGVTMLIIAHRLGTVVDCDKVIELAGGRVKAVLQPREARTKLEELMPELEDDDATSTGPKS